MDCFKKLFGVKQADVIPIKTVDNSAPIDIPASKTPWLDLAIACVGKCEGKDDEWIKSLFKRTRFGEADSSAVPWCAAFVCTMVELSGFKSTNSASAHEQENLGYECFTVPGAVLVWRHRYGSLSGHYHTNILVQRIDGKFFKCVGGNQSMSGTSGGVTVANYSLDAFDLVACRMPLRA